MDYCGFGDWPPCESLPVTGAEVTVTLVIIVVLVVGGLIAVGISQLLKRRAR